MMRILLLLLSSFTLLPSCGAVLVDQEQKLLIVKTKEKVELRCRQDESTYYNMFWYQQKPEQGLKLMVQSINVNSEDMENDYKRWSLHRPSVYNSTLTLNVSAIEDGAVYFCAARDSTSYGATLAFGSGTALVVLEPNQDVIDPKVSIYRPSKQEVEEHSFISLVCVASNFFPEHVKITWFVNGVERINLYEPVPQKKTGALSYSTSKRLTLTRSEYFNPESKFECRAGFYNRTISSAQVKGETDCSISKGTYTIHINQGKISYIMILCKSGLYALVVLALLWRKKVIASSH